MKIAIIEDERLHAELLVKYLKAWGRKKGRTTEISLFPSAEAFLFSWEEAPAFDVLFVDIQMKEMNGMEMARRVRSEDREIAIVFTTGIADYLMEGYEVEALHYLIKPISREKIGLCMDKVENRRKTGQYLLVHHSDGVRKILSEQINYVEARGHGAVLGLAGKDGDLWKDSCEGSGTGEQAEVLESLSELEKMLAQDCFFKCHRSYLCRIANIHHIDKKEIYFDNGSHIPVSRRMYAEVNQAFIQYFRKMDFC